MQKSLVVLDAHIQSSKQNEANALVLKLFKDTLAKRIETIFHGYVYYKENKPEITDLIFNESFTKVLIPVYRDEKDETVEFVNLYAGNFKENKWDFTHSVMSYSVDLENILGKVLMESRKKYAVKSLKMRLINDGLVKNNKVQNDYFIKWCGK